MLIKYPEGKFERGESLRFVNISLLVRLGKNRVGFLNKIAVKLGSMAVKFVHQIVKDR